MNDQFGRTIDYMRISITDKCNLRCQYCMPGNITQKEEETYLSFDEMIRICNMASQLGIHKFKITGGEPFIRKGCISFMKELKALPETKEVTLTTNGILLKSNLEELCAAKLDAINISLDTLDAQFYKTITGNRQADLSDVVNAITELRKRGQRIKINTVILEHTLEEAENLIQFAEQYGMDLRFIEIMPIGAGLDYKLVKSSELIEKIKERHKSLRPYQKKIGNGPARYYEADDITCKIGIIDAVSNCFCGSCNRIRLTSKGELKPCLAYGEGVNLKSLLENGISDKELKERIKENIYKKPKAHNFHHGQVYETRNMNQIGG